MDALNYTRELVAFESTSCFSNLAVSDYVEAVLKNLGFAIERLEYNDAKGIRKANIIGRRGSGQGGMAYFAHTDVVPADPWFTDEFSPFTPTQIDDKLYGRGSCDMKGSIACMLAAAKQYVERDLKHPLYITCTADEEVGYHGARNVAEKSTMYQEMVAGETHGIIGEPTRLEVVYAHKGTYGFQAISHGRAAHSSLSTGVNANLAMIPFLVEMKKLYEECMTDPLWQNEEFDPPTNGWNIGINDKTAAVNITPPQSICTVYFRPMPGQEPDELVERARSAAEKCGLEFQFKCGGTPVYTDPNSPFVNEVLQIAGKDKAKTVSYGTDGSLFPEMKNMVVFGPGDIGQAHTHDEFIELEQLELGTQKFASLIEHWCC
ncbi:M20 family metallopeptidase [uncultured Gimesia sp.]|uniref:M20 family metallopeptidase n=1 Tax=uncultured Gimesia sp. TaxID=1678688 RepID=UPI0030D77637